MNATITKRNFHLAARIILFLLAVFFLLSTLSGCRLSYLMHAATGQLKLIHDSISIEEAEKDETINPSVKSNLVLVAMVKDYGESKIGLKKTGNYETVYLKSRSRPIYTISASPRDKLSSITWWFPIVGNIPYLGFFDLGNANKMEQELLRKNFDVYMGIADAYSTLGWFNDPVTLNLLEGKTVDLIETILHEMTHATIYLAGKAELNEGLANIVGKVGALEFLKETFGPNDPLTLEASHILEDERIFSSYLTSLLNELDKLYGSSLSINDKLESREEIFDRALIKWELVKLGMTTDRFCNFGQGGLNNAYLLTIGLYHRNFEVFENFLREKNFSLKELIAFVKNNPDFLSN